MSCHQGDREKKPKKTHRWRGVSAGWLCACVSLGRNNQACVTDRQIFLANFQFTLIKFSSPLWSQFVGLVFSSFFFIFALLPILTFSILQLRKHWSPPPPRGDMWMLCVCLGFNWISPAVFLPQLLGFWLLPLCFNNYTSYLLLNMSKRSPQTRISSTASLAEALNHDVLLFEK